LYQSDVHLVEIDLLRRGARSLTHPRLPDSAYLMSVMRARSQSVDLWPLQLPDPLPILPVPLQAPDADVPLDLALALAAIYEEAAYDLSIDYQQEPPPPALSRRLS
jgi:hypothetical protein